MPLDRFGDRIDPEPDIDAHSANCRGWLGDDIDGRPVPCLTCKPHLKGNR